MTIVRTLLVDDSPQFIEAGVRFLSSDPSIEIVGTTTSGEDALELVELLKPDLVLMDIAMPGLNGLEATRLIKSKPNSPAVIMLTLHDNAEYRLASDSVQADGFIAKSDFGVDLLPLIYSLIPEPQPVGD